jgi:hypothetical protein
VSDAIKAAFDRAMLCDAALNRTLQSLNQACGAGNWVLVEMLRDNAVHTFEASLNESISGYRALHDAKSKS